MVPEPARAKDVVVNITKLGEGGDPYFPQGGGGHGEIRGGYSIGPDTPTYGMPSGPGFPPGDKAGGRRRVHRRKMKTFPRGILRKTHKIVPSRNPTRSPATRKRSVVLLSEKKLNEARKTAKHRAAKTPIATIRSKLVEKKILSGDKKDIPPTVLRKLYSDAVSAGLIN